MSLKQSPGSLTNSYSGTIDTMVAPGASIQFVSAAADADVSGIYNPGIGGGGGSADGDYGGYADLGIFGDLWAAVRTFVFSMSSGSITLAGSNFDASLLSLTTTGGDLDYDAGLLGSGVAPLVGESGFNQASNGSLVIGGGGAAILTVPIDLTMNFDLEDDTVDDTPVNIVGNIVATGIIPEPATLGLLFLGGFAFLRRIKRNRAGT